MSKEIIVVTIALGNDGAERVLTELSNEWIRQGLKVTAIQMMANVYGSSFSLSEKVQVINLKTKKKTKIGKYMDRFIQICKILNSKKNGTVLAFLPGPQVILAMCSPFVKNRIIFSERNNPYDSPDTKFHRFLRDIAFLCADSCVFQTKEARDYFFKRIRQRGRIIPNPINPSLPRPYQGERRKAIVAVCRLRPQKNLSMLIDAFYRLNKYHKDYILEIYGQGDEEEKLIAQIERLKLENSVFLKGFCSNVHEKMVDCAMYVSSSNYEGISNSMLEALAMGIPTVVTDCPIGGAKLMIQNNVNGILVPVGDSAKLCDAMRKVLENPDFSLKLSMNARKVVEKYPIDKIAKRWMEIF